MADDVSPESEAPEWIQQLAIQWGCTVDQVMDKFDDEDCRPGQRDTGIATPPYLVEAIKKAKAKRAAGPDGPARE